MVEKEDLNFEISFYEGLIEEKPDFVEALIPLGDAYTKRGLYEKGLEIDKRLARLRPDEPLIHYNLACSYSLLKMINEALEALNKATHLGYRDFDFMDSDPDLNNVKQDSRYKELVSKFKKVK